MTMTTELSHKFKIRIIEKLTKPEFHKKGQFWGREVKLFNQLIAKGYSDREFWETFDLEYKLNSLAGLVKGKELEGAYNTYLLKRVSSLN